MISDSPIRTINFFLITLFQVNAHSSVSANIGAKVRQI